MTREEEIKKAAFEYADKELIGIIDFKKETAFIEGAKWADAHPHWISVEDELPIDYEPVVAVVGGNHFAFVGICLNQTTWYCDIQNKMVEIKGITHWMPLPQPPKEGGEE